jgi:hypothetical protein
MGISMKNVKAATKATTVKWEGEEAKLTYRPSAVTPAMMDEVLMEEENGKGHHALTGLLVHVLVDWEVLDDDGEPLPITSETLSERDSGSHPGGYGRGGSTEALRRWLVTQGQVGFPPYWYRVIRAAKYLGCPPWELSHQPITWLQYAEASMSAEAAAEEAAQKRMERRARKG